MTAGFGLEKLGVLTARYPRTALLIFAASLPLFLFLASRIEFSSNISEIFRSTSAEYAVLEKVTEQYPDSGRDVLLVVEGGDIFEPDALNALRNLHLDLTLVPEVGSVLSIFSARHPPNAEGVATSLFPTEIGQDTDVEAIRKEVMAHPLVSDRMISEDGDLALLSVTLTDKERDVSDLRNVIDEINATANDVLEGSGLKVTPTGLAAMRVEIIGALIRDQGRFAIAGLFLGLGFCWLFFRRLAYVVMAGLPAAAAVIWLAAGMSLAGQEINVLTNIIPVLVVVLVFSDALHLLFGVRHNIADGQPLQEAIETAVHEVGPACVLTSLTTTLALLSLTLVPHEFISSFGLTAAFGTALAYCATIALVPAMARLFLARTPRKRSRDAGEYWIGRTAANISAAAARAIQAAPYPIAGAGIVLTVCAGILYAQNTPHYSYQENLPEGNAAFGAIQQIDAHLGGSNSMWLMIQWPEGHQLQSRETLQLIGEAQAILESEPEIQGATSLAEVARWAAGENGDPRQVFQVLETSDSPLTTRLASPAHNSALLTAQFDAIDSSELLPILDDLQRKLDRLRAANPDVNFYLTGLTPVAAHASMEMIGKLNQSLAMAIGVIIVLIGVALRSVLYGLASILPNLLPIAAGGTYLYLNGFGLQFTSVVAFTVAFGIAVDSTIHVLNRYRLSRARADDVDEAIGMTLRAIGPVLIVATIVLICGIAVTMLSELPMVRLYGQISSIVLVTALAGAMVFLPAILGLADRWLNSPRLAPPGRPASKQAR